MKPLFIFFTILFCTNAFCQSRCEKGTWVVGLNPINYSFLCTSKRTSYQSDTITARSTGKTNGIAIGFNIGGGYFVKDNFCIGAGFGNYIIGPGISPIPLLPTNLFARYYLMQKKHCFSFTRQDNTNRYAFFMQGTIIGSYSVLNSEDKSAINGTDESRSIGYSYGCIAAIGYTYMFAKHVALELMGLYGNNTWSVTNTSILNGVALPTTKFIYNNSGFNLLFGVQTYF